MEYVVVIPSCNRYDYLVAAVRSVLRQTLPPRAVWVVDDASTDSRYRIAYELSDPLVGLIGDGSTDPRYLTAGDELADPSVHVIRRPVNSKAEHGCGYAIGAVRNTAIHALLCGLWNGWVAFLDDDDVWRPEKMAATAKVAAAWPDAVAIGTDVTFISPGGEPIGLGGAVGGDEVGEQLLDVTGIVRHTNPLANSTVAMPMRVIRKIGLMQPTGYPEDWDYWRRAAEHGRLLRITRDLAMYRMGNQKEYRIE